MLTRTRILSQCQLFSDTHLVTFLSHLTTTHSLETWGSRILNAVERQERILSENALINKDCLKQHESDTMLPFPPEVDVESISRNDALKTPITGADMILSWPIFPKKKPVNTFPASAFSEKPDRFQPGMS